MTELPDSHSLLEGEEQSMPWRLRFATSFGRSSRTGRLDSNRTHTLSTPHPHYLPRRGETPA